MQALFLLNEFSLPRRRVRSSSGSGFTSSSEKSIGPELWVTAADERLSRERQLQSLLVSAGDMAVRLTPTEWHLVEVLVRHPGKLVSQRQLLQEVWCPRYEEETNYLRVYMAQIRRKLHAENVRLDGHLYRFELAPYPDGPSEGSTSGVATLTDQGFLNTLLFHWQVAGDEVSVGFTYSAYNSGITVEPPPPDLIVKQAPAIACPSPMPPPSGVLPNGADFCDVIEPSPETPSGA